MVCRKRKLQMQLAYQKRLCVVGSLAIKHYQSLISVALQICFWSLQTKYSEGEYHEH
uniref:Uncharacterized protein n=1 Tax=Phage sp. ctIHi3 TaxID=2825791 RepID=A0A8S5Q6R8_9VIRU|nr:MAG TPA: hypothetical protein [Phage sp. ctIHi3]